MILISYNWIYLWSAIFVKCGFFSTATHLISKNCLILVLLSSIKKFTILETKCKYLHKNKQTVFIYCVIKRRFLPF